jgi:hypothetical protein
MMNQKNLQRNCSETTVWRQGGKLSKFRWSYLCQNFQKVTNTKRFKEEVMHIWLADIKALSGTSDRKQTHIFGQGLIFKYTQIDYFYWLQICPFNAYEVIYSFSYSAVLWCF